MRAPTDSACRQTGNVGLVAAYQDHGPHLATYPAPLLRRPVDHDRLGRSVGDRRRCWSRSGYRGSPESFRPRGGVPRQRPRRTPSSGRREL